MAYNATGDIPHLPLMGTVYSHSVLKTTANYVKSDTVFHPHFYVIRTFFDIRMQSQKKEMSPQIVLMTYWRNINGMAGDEW